MAVICAVVCMFKRNADETLCGEVVDLGRSCFLQKADTCAQVGQIKFDEV